MEDLAKRVAHTEADLAHYKAKSHADDEMIAVLKRQKETQAMEMEQMAHDYANEFRRLRQRSDLAVQRETEITGILDAAAKGIIDGMRRMRGDEARQAETPKAQTVPPAPRTIAIHPDPGPAVGDLPEPEDYADLTGIAGVRKLVSMLPPNEFVPRETKRGGYKP